VNVLKIEGIGPVNADRLREQGITTTEALLEAAADQGGRVALANKTGLAQALILEWVNRADLMRIKGVGEEYSDLLECSGVDTIKELRRRNPENLQKALQAVNSEKNLVRRVPSVTEVEKWIAQAKELPIVISY
jgi:predicted flap endonuclease-1-like 5' DNA nuclease